jgi:hypothetical protein
MTNKLVLLCVLLALAGCGPKGPAQTVENYFPLAVGNRWIYSTGATGTTETISVTESFLNASQVRVYKWGGEDVLYGSNTGGRVVLRADPDDTTGIIILSEPFEVGAAWAQEGETSRITDTKAGISTPAGDFTDCIKVSDPDTTDVYFAPGVGLVKVMASNGTEIMKLIEYGVK